MGQFQFGGKFNTYFFFHKQLLIFYEKNIFSISLSKKTFPLYLKIKN